MVRSVARQAFAGGQDKALVQEDRGSIDDFWSEEPTAVDAALTMQELIRDELDTGTAVPDPANDRGRGTPRR